jgi:uncharacterized protein
LVVSCLKSIQQAAEPLPDIVPKRQRKKSPSRAKASRNGVSNDLIVRKSPVHGRGVFAAKPLRKGARIIEYTGRRILWSSVPDELDDPRMYYFGLGDGKRVIDPSVGVTKRSG